MTDNNYNKVAWFEIGSANTEKTKSFFKEVFGWDFKQNHNLEGVNYSEIMEGNTEKTTGGVLGTASSKDDYAIFYVLVENTDETISKVKENDGAVLWGPVTDAAGITFVRLLDNDGHQFGVFSVK